MNSMGNLSSIMKHLPNMKNVSKLNIDEKNLVWTKAIIDSMTNYERKKPEIINGSRKKRIAQGSGTSMQKVNQLLKQFKQMKTLMKKMNSKKFGKLPFLN
jgi:signal recognition particle subunit SRP54